jgi:Flp pilus assembly protein TadG
VNRLRSHICAFGADQRGVAAIETALITSLFAIATLNVIDVGRYAYVRMEADLATQAGAEAALVTCDAQHVPATQACPNLNSAVTTAIRGTSLGAAVGLNGAITEGYYCVTSAGVLVYASTVSSPPANCSGFGNAAGKPALYLQVRTRYAYAPIFPGLTVAQTFPTSVQKTAWMRML